jgi:four helix bundle protein
MRNFRNYRVWHNSIELVDNVYTLTESLPKEEDYILKSQMRRAAISIASNIAEGCGRDGQKDFKRFVEFSLGSSYELETQLIISDRRHTLHANALYKKTIDHIGLVQAELNALRNTLK